MDQSIKQKSRELAAKAARLYKHLSSHKKETILSAELLRAGAGVGANLARSECAMGKNDQLAKVYGAFQKCVEAKYWLEVLNDNEYLTELNSTISSLPATRWGKFFSAW
jgi:four helix bundle protein